MSGTTWDDKPVDPAPAGSGPDNSGGSPIPLTTINPFDTAQVKAFRDGAEKAKTMAQQGGYAINEDGGILYTKACDTFIQGYENIESRKYELAKRPKLGARPYAQKLADHWLKVIDGDPQSLLPNLQDMYEGYKAFKEAIQIARKNYNETESAHDQYFGKMKPE